MMARSWRDYQPQGARPDPHDKIDNSDEIPARTPEKPDFVTNVTNVTRLPADVRQGVTWLSNSPAPRVRRPDDWPEVVADALRLVSEGWAERALALGWSALDLFGAVPKAGGDPDGDGLALKLRGRHVLALCSSFATVEDGNGGRAYLYRPQAAGAVLLWKLGRRG